MPERDLRNIRARKLLRNGEWIETFQVRSVGVDTETFETLEAAHTYRDYNRTKVRLGEVGDRLDANKRANSTTLDALITEYKRDWRFMSKASHKNELASINAFCEHP